MSESWQSIAARKKEEQTSRIPKEWLLAREPSPNLNNVLSVPRSCRLLSERELAITENYDATALAEEIAKGRLKSVDVVTAFCKRAAIAHQLTNCLTEIMFEDALSRAKKLDEHLKRTGKPIGPLHGVPISLKDTFRVPGYDASIGIASLCFKPATTASTLVDILLAAGAVLYVKTNVPQTLMALDSHNNVFGRTLNPRNLLLTPGGSSGGEGALIAMRGSVLGVGTDVGGSIRIPAMCNGLYGIKPSAGRVPYAGQENGTLPGASALGIPASAGPLATSLRDCELFLKTVSAAQPWKLDPLVVPGSWETQDQSLDIQSCGRTSEKKMRVGIVRTDGLITPLPPIGALLDEVAQTLRSSSSSSENIEVVDVDISSLFSQCQSLANALFGIDGGAYIFSLLARTSEPLSPWLQSRLKEKSPKTLEQVRALHAKKNALETAFLKVWRNEGKEIDAFICPVAPHPVPPVDRWNGVSYTSSFVMLDYPAGTLPVRSMHPEDLKGEIRKDKPLSSWDKVNRELWTPADRSLYVSSPLCIQVVAPKLQERRLYRAMERIDEALAPLRAREAQGQARARL
ncbi:acetamidase [Cryomyces antarcticus]